MKYFGPVFIVVALLLSAAVYYNVNARAKSAGVVSGEVDEGPVVVWKAGAQGSLELSAALSHKYWGGNLSGSHLYTSIDITAEDLAGAKRSAVNVALVIDRSGSMIGQPIADARQAAQDFVNRLREGDSVTIVSFSDRARVDFPSQRITGENRREIQNAIGRIQANGGTNISDGYQAGVRELEKIHDDRSIDRVILLTDGQPNYGMTSVSALVGLAGKYQRENVTLTAIGFGLHYNEDLMASMADAGGGNYYFAKDEQAVAGAFSTEFQQLNSLVARRAVVRVALAKGVRVEQVYGYPFEQNGHFVEVPLAEFYGGQNKNILMKLSMDTHSQGMRQVVDVQLNYEDTMREKEIVESKSLAVSVTEDSRLLEKGLSTDVLTRVEEVEIAESVQVAMTQYQEGRAEEAVKTIRKQKERTSLARKIFGLPEEKFQSASVDMEDKVVLIQSVPAASPQARQAVMESKAKGRSISQSKRSSGW